MNCRVILAVAFAALVAIQIAGAHPLAKRSCACNLKGTDVCGSCIPSGVIRPSRLRAPVTGVQRVVYQKYAPIEFQPKNICTCESSLVTAPEVPRVPCQAHSGPARQSPNYAYDGSANIFGTGESCGDAVDSNPCEDSYAAPASVRTYVIPSDNLPAEELIEEVPAPAPQAPIAADAVSLALAYDLATKSQKNILEENLAFGHMQTPKDGRVITRKRIVPENGLYAVRNQIVELKAPTGYGRSCEDEAEASLLAAQQSSCGEVEESSYSGSLPSYRDLGFSPVSGDCKLVPGQYQPAPRVVQTVEYSVPAAATVTTGNSYSACDALGSVERGRGQTGYDYYSNPEPQPEEPEAAPCPEESNSGIYSAGLSYGAPVVASAPAPVAKHTGRPGCSCGCGY